MVQESRIAWEVDVQKGFVNAPRSLLRLFTEGGSSKRILEV